MSRFIAPFSSPVSPHDHPQSVAPLHYCAVFAVFVTFARMRARAHDLIKKRFSILYTRENYTKMTKMTKFPLQVPISIGKSFCVTWVWVTKLTQFSESSQKHSPQRTQRNAEENMCRVNEGAGGLEADVETKRLRNALQIDGCWNAFELIGLANRAPMWFESTSFSILSFLCVPLRPLRCKPGGFDYE